MWAISDTDVRPDVMLVGKTLSGGVVPVAAVLASERAYAPFEQDPFLHQSTFSGAPSLLPPHSRLLRLLRSMTS